MQAEFSLECGADDEYLVMPWASEDGSLRYVDLKRTPWLIDELPEARLFPELAEFLRGANSQHSAFYSAKCDAGFTREMTLEDEVFGTTGKFGSYVDVLFTSPESQRSFEQHEAAARNLTSLLRRAPEMQASAEFLVRRCFYVDNSAWDGLYITIYVFGYSENEDDARKYWGIALRLVVSAMVQISTEFR